MAKHALLAAASLALAFLVSAPVQAQAQQLSPDASYQAPRGQGFPGRAADEEKFAQVQEAYYETCGDDEIYNITLDDLKPGAKSLVLNTPLFLIKLHIGANCGNHDAAAQYLRD